MTQTYLFYDLETSGLAKEAHQVLQFACIRTDLQFNEISREQFYVRLSPDTIIAPGAIITHRIHPSTLKTGKSELEAIFRIHQLLNTPGTISIGYNSLNFDDEFLRFSFFRHLLPVYTHQYANSCRRMDLYPIVVFSYLYKREALKWPKINEKISLKLENLNKMNNFATGPAHDAMVDVEVTLALAKKIFAYDAGFFSYLAANFVKNTETSRVDKILNPPQSSSTQEALMIEGIFGADSAFQAWVYYLGQHKHYKNQTLWLRLDLPELSETTDDNFTELPWVIHKKQSEPPFVLPTSAHYTADFSLERQAVVTKNREWLNANPSLLKKLRAHYCQFTFPDVPEADANARLYLDGFLSSHDQTLAKTFHKSTNQNKVNCVPRFQSPTQRTLALRLIARETPENLSPENNSEFLQYLQNIEENKILNHQLKPHLSKKQALAEINTLQQDSTLDQEQQSLLQDLKKLLC
jgi:exodeoxyribonuclease-1